MCRYTVQTCSVDDAIEGWWFSVTDVLQVLTQAARYQRMTAPYTRA